MTLPAAVANRKDNDNKNTFSNPIELPSMQIADAADIQKEQAFQALEYSSDADGQYQYVKCQYCSKNIRIVGKLQTPKKPSERIGVLQKRIKWLEYQLSHNSYYYNNGKASAAREIKQAKEELQRLQAEDAKYDKFRSLPLYSSKCTGHRFFCSSCWEQAYQIAQEERKKEKGLVSY
jgi:DNA-directed RNA polymerase subunit RPC12/RpoP